MNDRTNPVYTDKNGYFRTDFPKGFNTALGYAAYTKHDESKCYDVFKLNQTRTLTALSR